MNKTPIEYLVSMLTDFQLASLDTKVWNDITSGNGYQPWGYDVPTLRMTNPIELIVLQYIRTELHNRKAKIHDTGSNNRTL